MKNPIRILIVEDEPDDAALAKYEICKTLSDCEFQVAETREGFLDALSTFQPDVILSDYTLPYFDGMKALELTLRHAPLTPLIIWTGSIGEDVAVDCVKAGANNYILKENLKRLGPAVLRALEERELLVARRQAEEALQNNEKRFRALVENGPADISLLAADGTLLWESPSTTRNLGYAAGEFVGRNIFELMHPDDLAWTRDTYAKLLQQPGDRQHGIFRLRRADGTWRWVEAVATNMLHEPGVNAIVINYRDITEQKQSEIELQQRNADLALVNALNEVINRGEGVDVVVNLMAREIRSNFSAEGATVYLLDQTGRFLTMQQYFLSSKILEKIEGLIGRTIPAIEIPLREGGYFHRALQSGSGIIASDPKVIQTWMEEFVETHFLPSATRGVIRKLIPQIYELLNIKSTILVPLISDGKPIGLLDVSSPNLFTKDDLKRIENIGRQLTIAIRRKQVEEELRESQARYQNLVETSHDLIWSVDAEARFTFVNRASREIYGYEPEELIGRSFFEILDPKHNHTTVKKFQEAIANVDELREVETYVRHRDGRQIILSTNSIVLRDEHGSITGVVGSSHDITIRNQVADELKEERNLLRTLIDNIPDRIYAMDLRGRKTLSNIADWRACGGKTMEDVIGKTDFDTYSPALAEDFWKLDQAVLNTGQPLINYEEPGLDAGGNFVSILTSKIPLCDDNGKVVGLVGIGRDITERKQTEEKLRASEARFRTFVDHATDAFFLHDEQGTILDVNHQACESLGYRYEELIGLSPFDFDPDLVPATLQQILARLTAGEVMAFDTHHRRKDGTIFPVEIRIRAFQEGGRRFSVSLVRDITERKQAEARINDLLAFNEKILNHTSIGIITYKITGECVFANETAASIVGAQVEQLRTQNFHNIESWKEYGLYDLVEKTCRTHEPVAADIHMITTFGKDVWMTLHCVTFRSKEEDHILLTMMDITERKQVEEKLRRNESQYRLATKATNDVIWEWDPKTNQLLWSENARHVFGYPEEEIGPNEKWWDDHLHPDDRGRVLTRLDALIAGHGSNWLEEYRFLLQDGSYAYISDRGYIERDEHGAPIRMIGAMSDITSRKEAEIERQALLEIMQGLANTKDLQELLKLVQHSIAKVIYAENFFVVLYQRNTGLFEEIYSVDQYDPPEPPSKLEHSITSYVFRSGEPLLLTQASFNELEARGEVKLVGTNSASWLGVPLKTSGRTIGVMAVQDYENENRYSEREREFLASIAAQVALAIERRQAEEALRESEEHYRTIFEGVQDAIFVESLDGKILMVNERACEMFGYSRAEFLTKTVADLVPPSHPILMTDREEASISAEPRETINQRANGEVFPIEISGRVQIINGEQVLLVVVRDITERKQSEDLLRESEERFSGAFEYASIGMALVAPNGALVRVNWALCWLLGYSETELLGKTFLDLTHPDDLQDGLDHVEKILAGEIDSFEVEKRYFHKQGHVVWGLLSVSLVKDNQGKPQHFIAQIQDITERKRVEESLQAERKKAEKYLETAGVMMLALDREGTVTLINQKGCEILGYSADEIIGKNWIDTFLPQATKEEMHNVLQRIISDDIQSLEYYENSILTKSGEQRLIAWHNTLLRDEQGRIISSLSSGEDITKRKQVETALRESVTQFRTLFEASPDAIVLIDPNQDWMIIDCNAVACQMNGYTREELLGQSVNILNLTPGHPNERKEYMESVRQHGILHYETSHRRKDGTVFTVDVSTSLIKFGTRDLVLGIDRDVTARKRAEEEIRRRAEETSALLETSLALTSLDLESTLQTVGNSANRLFLADGCRIFLLEPDGETLRCVLALGENTNAFLNLRIKIGQGVTGVVAASGRAEIINDMQNDPRAVQMAGTEEEPEAIMFAPLKERDRVIGILSIRRVGREHPFQDADLELLEAFASMTASAVSNARLFEETQHRLSELNASEERFRQLADNIQEAFWMTDAESGRELYMSPAVETIWGRSIQSLMYEPNAWINSVFSEDRPALQQAVEREKNGEKVQLEYRIVRPDGTLRWIWDRAFPIFDDAGRVKRIAGISADITERKEAAEKLRESEDRYHSLFQNQLHGSALHEIITNGQGQPVDYVFLKVNPAFEKMTGLKAQDILGRRVTEVLPGIENESLIQIYGKVVLTGQPVHINEYFTPLGRYYEINAYSTGHGRFAVSFVDVTERMQAEQELRKLSRAVEQSGSTIVITDTAGNIEYINPKFTQITGYSFEEVIGQNPRMLKSGFTSDEEYKQLWQTISTGNQWHGELLNKKKDGTLFWESVTVSPILNDRREITHFVGVKEDITERKQNEIETRRHIAELEAVYENGLSVSRLLEPGEIGNCVIETFAHYLPWHHVTIRLRKEGSDDLELVSFNLPNLKEEERTDTEQHFIARINKVGQGLSGWAIQTGAPFRTGNVHAHPQYIDTHAGIQSGLYMPLKVGERIIGVISVESEAPNAFTEQDERLLATLANQTAVAFENARLYEAMQMELSERKRAENDLRISETHYRALADSITDILFELDQNLRYTHWNKASETLTGIPAEEAIGKSMEEILGATEEQARIKTIYQEVLRTQKPKTFETMMVVGGENRSFEVNAYPSMRGVSVVAKDVTDRKRNETIMQKRFELMEFSARHSLNELMLRTVDEVSEITGSTIGFFHFMQEDQVHLGMQTWSTNALQLFHVAPEDGGHLPVDQAGVWAEAIRKRRPLIQNDYESLLEKKGIPYGHAPVVREMIIPIIRNERIMAVMGIGNKSQDYSAHDLELAARLADYAWDITERKQMELALEVERNQLVQRVEERTADLSRANSNLARALRVKDEFLANMSHELRTPLNAILGLSESLGEQIAGPLNEKQQKYISTISESGHHLLSLINDILDLAKIDAGQITLDINKVDIHSVCQASLRMVKQLAQKKNQEISLEIDNGLGLMWADERRLKQMIVNLLGNAVKFTPEYGKLGLEVRGDEEANQIAITVWDNGIGIKQEDLARLFQPFVQLDSGLAREATGTGLGLALVAQMARLHGGSVNAVSDAGTGSRFTIILPWEPALAMDAASRMRITGKFRAIQFDEKNKPTILLVEDTKEVIMMLKDYLELAGYNVFTAQDGVDGIVQARHVKPDLILMDVQMPRMDGFETTRKLRSDPNFRYTPIIALTALAMPHDRERCLEAGMDEYISKPVNLKALIKIIQNCLFEQESRTR